jgi:hypothetical protein
MMTIIILYTGKYNNIILSTSAGGLHGISQDANIFTASRISCKTKGWICFIYDLFNDALSSSD